MRGGTPHGQDEAAAARRQCGGGGRSASPPPDLRGAGAHGPLAAAAAPVTTPAGVWRTEPY
ncbi:hypothetical protein, partial [Streptomyces sp. NPDC056045]|uniref:hypothetical protein n=1 Tax=Streptomyces sp. NPDC056045 TaxID=3345691 RepID=UPI0035D7C654